MKIIPVTIKGKRMYYGVGSVGRVKVSTVGISYTDCLEKMFAEFSRGF